MTIQDATKIGNDTFGDFRTRHANCTRSGLSVISWEQFEAIAKDLLAASDDLRAAVSEVCVIQDSVIPAADQHVGFLKYVNDATYDLFDLTRSDFVPNYLHDSDLQFRTTYGKAKRNPVAKMTARLKELRQAAAMLRRRAAELRPLCGGGWKGGA